MDVEAPRCKRCFAKVDQAQVELCERAGVPLFCLVCPKEMEGPVSERMALAQRSYRRQATGVDWLRELDLRLWRIKEMRGRRGPSWFLEERHGALDNAEWSELLRVVEEVEAPMSLVNVSFGFNIGMVVYEPEKKALYPGVEEYARSSAVLVVSAQHLPHQSGRVSFDEAWDTLSPLVMMDKNLERLRRCGVPQPPSKGQLAY